MTRPQESFRGEWFWKLACRLLRNVKMKGTVSGTLPVKDDRSGVRNGMQRRGTCLLCPIASGTGPHLTWDGPSLIADFLASALGF